MNDVAVIDRFLNVFSTYIDSGFGLLSGEVAFLSATLVVIDMTLAGLFWAMGHASGQGDDIMAKLVKKVLYVGAFAYIIGNFNMLAGIVFKSFAGLGLVASGSTLTQAEFLQPGKLAQVGIDAGTPILAQIKEMTGFPEVFANIDAIVVMLLAWLVVVMSFFTLAIQLFVTLLEFKLTTLAGFVLVPFALWNKTSFLAEKVLGNVVSSGIKVLVLAVIVGIGTGLFAEFQVPINEPSIDHAAVMMLASLTLLALGIFGPGVATGLVSGAPQLGAGAAAGTALAVAGGVATVGAAAAGVGSAIAAGARMAPAPAPARSTAPGTHAATSTAGSAKPGLSTGGGGHGIKGAAAGLGKAAKAGAQSLGQKVAAAAQSIKAGASAASKPHASKPAAGTASGMGGAVADGPPHTAQPAWAKRLHHKQQIGQAASTVAHTLRGGDAGGSGPAPQLRDPSDD